jgi:hypothetical protein
MANPLQEFKDVLSKQRASRVAPWFVEQQGAHELALARARNLAQGVLKSNEGEVVFGWVTVTKTGPEWFISSRSTADMNLKEASIYSKDLQAALVYCKSFDLIMRKYRR